MNWSAIGSVGEFVGAIGVIGSLIYLALQVRAGSKTLFTAMRESTFNSLIEWNKTVMSDPDLAWIFQQGSRDYNSLDQKERARYVHVMYSFYKLFENIFLHYKDNLISEKVWQYNQLLLLAYAAQPGATNYWSLRRSAFDPRFRKMVDEIHSTEIPTEHSIEEMDIPDIVNEENET